MDVEARKRSLRYFFAKIVERLGYKFPPDEKLADYLWSRRPISKRRTAVRSAHARDERRTTTRT